MTDTTALENVTDSEDGRQDLSAGTVDNLNKALLDVEEHLRKKRNQIEKIQLRHEELINELGELDNSLQAEILDFVLQFNAFINIDDLDTNSATLGAPPDKTASDASPV